MKSCLANAQPLPAKEYEKAVEEFIARKGITRCPTATPEFVTARAYRQYDGHV